MIYYGYKKNSELICVNCYQTVDNVPSNIADTWAEITEQEFNDTTDKYANIEETDTPSLEQRVNDLELALMEIAEVM